MITSIVFYLIVTNIFWVGFHVKGNMEYEASNYSTIRYHLMKPSSWGLFALNRRCGDITSILYYIIMPERMKSIYRFFNFFWISWIQFKWSNVKEWTLRKIRNMRLPIFKLSSQLHSKKEFSKLKTDWYTCFCHWFRPMLQRV